MEKTLSSTIVYKGKVVSLRVEEVLLENGTLARREVVEHPGAVAVLAVTGEEKEVFFVRQYRKPVEKMLLEIPAGKLEAGEDPAACAARELAEETGMAAGELRQIASFYSSPGFASEKLYIFLATGLKPAPGVAADADEIIQAVRFPLRDAVEMARQGGIEDAKTLVALLLAADMPGI